MVSSFIILAFIYVFPGAGFALLVFIQNIKGHVEHGSGLNALFSYFGMMFPVKIEFIVYVAFVIIFISKIWFDRDKPHHYQYRNNLKHIVDEFLFLLFLLVVPVIWSCFQVEQFSGYTSHKIIRYFGYTIVSMILGFVFILKKKEFLGQFIYAVFIMGLIYGLFEIQHHLFHQQSLIAGKSRLNYGSTVGNAMIISTALYWYHHSQKPRLFPLILVCLSTIMVLLSTSRGQIVFAFISSIFISLQFFRFLRRRIISRQTKLILLGLSLAASIVGFGIFFPKYLDVFFGRLTKIEGRIGMYDRVYATLLQSPFLGVGFGETGGAELSTKFYPHNFFLEFWVETGLFGLLFVSAGVLIIAKRIVMILHRIRAVDFEGLLIISLIGLLLFYFLLSMKQGDVNGVSRIWLTLGAMIMAADASNRIEWPQDYSKRIMDGRIPVVKLTR